MTELARTQFGNPILRRKACQLTATEIISPKIQKLINDMRFTLVDKKLGVGLAAPQVGQAVAMAVIAIRPTDHRPNVRPFDLVLINPRIVEKYGEVAQRWEGCISAGSSGKADLFAKVPRHKRIKVTFLDEHAQLQTRIFTGLQAQVVQHEVDHLNGILFVDRVTETKTYMTYSEYMHRIRKIKPQGER